MLRRNIKTFHGGSFLHSHYVDYSFENKMQRWVYFLPIINSRDDNCFSMTPFTKVDG